TKCKVLVLARNDFQRFIKKYPDLRDTLTHIMSQGMVSALEKIPFLQGVTFWKLQLLGSLFQYVTVAKNETIFHQVITRLFLFGLLLVMVLNIHNNANKKGDIGHEMFILSSGSVKISAENEQGEEHEIARLREGQYFGEIALMVNMPRTATVVATEDCLLLSL